MAVFAKSMTYKAFWISTLWSAAMSSRVDSVAKRARGSGSRAAPFVPRACNSKIRPGSDRINADSVIQCIMFDPADAEAGWISREKRGIQRKLAEVP